MSVDVFARIRSWAPRELLSLLDQVVYFFPVEARLNLKHVVNALPASQDNLTRIFEVVRQQWRDLRSQDQLRIAVVGPAQTGKLSVVQAFSRLQADPDPVSFSLVDFQGLEEYLGYRPEGTVPDDLLAADVVLLVLDAQYEVSDSTASICRRLSDLPGKVLVVLNKIDLAEAPGAAVRNARRLLRTSAVPMSTMHPKMIDDLVRAIVALQPRALYPLSRAFPRFRKAMCQAIVQQAAFAAAIAGAFPVPFPFFLPGAAVHSAMLLKLASAFGHRLDSGRAKELLPVLALDLVLDRGIEYLEKRYPRRKAFISASVSGLYTYALGQVAIKYFEMIEASMTDGARVLPGPGNHQFSWNKE